MAFQHEYPTDIVLLGIALPIVWILTIATKGITLKCLCQYVSLSVFSIMLCGQYFYYFIFTQCCITPVWGALGFSLFYLLIEDDDNDIILNMVRAFVLEYALLSTPSALYAVIGATLWIVSIAVGTTLCRHL